MIAKTSCQLCGQHIEFEVENAGETVACPSCGQQTRLLLPSKPATVQPAPVKTNQNSRSILIVGTVAGIMVVCLIGFGLSHITRNKPVESEIKIAAVQSNAPVIPKEEPLTAAKTEPRENISKPTTEFAKAGPFGFDPGMTKQQIIDELGQNAIKEAKGDVLTLDNAPRPHSGFEEYILVIDPKRGLVKLHAVGVDISTSVYGDELKSAFNSMEESIASGYGVSKRYDFLRVGSIWDERKDYMMGLLKKERTLESFWPNNDSIKLKGQVATIDLEARALSDEKGYLLLDYEFVGFQEYHEEQKNKENQVF